MQLDAVDSAVLSGGRTCLACNFGASPRCFGPAKRMPAILQVRDGEGASTRGRVRSPDLECLAFLRILAKHAENGIADITWVAGWYVVRAIADAG